MVSRYCRNTPTYREKKFLYPGTTIANLHREYKMNAEKKEIRAAEIIYFSNKFHEKTFLFSSPGKIGVTYVNLSNMET